MRTFHGARGISDFHRYQQTIIKSKSVYTFYWFKIIITITIISITMSQSMAIETNKRGFVMFLAPFPMVFIFQISDFIFVLQDYVLMLMTLTTETNFDV